MNQGGEQPHLIDAGTEFLPRLLEINQEAAPAVGDVDLPQLTALAERSCLLKAVQAGDGLAGFILALTEDTDYASDNYRWFVDRYDDFVYIDRVAVVPGWKRRGLGRMLYEAVFDFTAELGKRLVACEVNLRPLNQLSLDFHQAFGFEEVGQRESRAGKRVSMLLREQAAGS